ncbi:Myb-like DNA-binding domain containing protein [Trichomonas vaginalis G3]|uniref:Myb-like DNA-binding domain containing protein n=1 Tax=Trichomonas vaginalis (strain ATCC PRA-98 / G3) TaxID=412133 RepID=A2DFQ0_TRIV3|nr:RNA polymerase II transcription regulator recruiting protein [Trichomonas vaginalis G3]EAY20753.1 Myb-like DNA-binding domain containing protein [Trichomonas vaginalis G3]KAI5529467.1 RNA polymerase II transcription regulator recruiting protein [Trichomonas vaginalis G3]|eukprot:XP_001581739.1 Myb-like DNA-binding domain containing protein [Trichomonas vaginalis G3]
MDRLLPSGVPPHAGTVGGKSKFTPEEDLKLKQIVESQKEPISWKEISRLMVTRTPRQCRERYKNYLSDSIKHEKWSDSEDVLIMQLFSEYGNKWNIISKYIPGRTSNSIRNRWKYLSKNEVANVTEAPPKNEAQPSDMGELLKIQAPEPSANNSAPSVGDKIMDRLMNNMFPQGKPANIFESDEDISIFVS